ncbi:hypothetical protein K490DRAFT_73377 [Saccharata proteae CBS 121410]|uniref:Urease accessory protein UreD n=1 Tax=Saccharata proteae CBS 121410 TaxID=1314787 RepID=A0A9P4HW80_9PEZI|nr:hypothetical protein K490DRAFT_73377 [Saccharata proteae CBS 121410]
MPHKHKRQRKPDDLSSHDLPPTARAKPLPVRESGNLTDNFASKTVQRKKAKAKKRADGYGLDDTPKAFARLMQLGKTGKGPSGLDNGDQPRGKKRKLADAEAKPAKPAKPASAKPEMEKPTIMPGERMSDFAARVNQALPVAGLARKGKAIEGVKERQTKTEKRMHKMYAEWREEEAKRKEREEEARELAEEEEEEKNALYGEDKTSIPAGKKGKRKKLIGETDDGEDDPWAVLKTRRDAPKGINDVVQAPPTFKAIPKEKFKVRNGAKVQVADIPKSAGSLARREELGETRKSIIESYRAMMESRRNTEKSG